VVVVIIGILAGISIPSYLSFRGRATNTAAQSNLRAIVPDIESYFADTGTYVGMTLAGLKASYDQAIDVAKYNLPAAALSATSYCIDSTASGATWNKAGPAATPVTGACP
jgi:type IV pilus assembly protein PilA